MEPLMNEKDIYTELIIQHLSGNISNEDLRRLNSWLELSQDNRLLYDHNREIWLSTKALANTSHFDYHQAYQRFVFRVKELQPVGNTASVKKVLFTLPRVAAIFAIAFGLGILVHYFAVKPSSVPTDVAQQEITVPLGSKSKIKLPDGTLVILNAGSKFTYKTNFGKTNREVWLEGEGYFSVAKDKKRTFVVKTKYIDIKALGTEFNVKAYTNEKIIQTTLIEGSVKIEKTFKGPKDKEDMSVILKPRQRYTFLIKPDTDIPVKNDVKPLKSGQKDYKQAVVDIDPIPDISWKEQRWIISQEQLGELAIKLERRYDVNINFADKNLKSLRFTGTLKDESIEQVLKVISLSSPIVFEIHGKQVVLHKNDEFAQKYKGLYKSN
jgi:transmembrane sensor